MDLAEITPLIITYDEEANIGRTLAALAWASRIVVVDSGSTDGTLGIIGSFSTAEVVARPFDTFADQCNHGLSMIRSKYTLSLDADHVLAEELVAELREMSPQGFDGWRSRFKYVVAGQALRATLLPPRVTLFRTLGARFRNDGHAHHVVVQGPVADLKGHIFHDDRKPLSRWLSAQARYSADESRKLLSTPKSLLSVPDRVRRCYLGPVAVLPYCLFWKGLILDGWRGVYYSLQRLVAELILALALLEFRSK